MMWQAVLIAQPLPKPAYKALARAVIDAVVGRSVAVPDGWRDFIVNIATPYSEPLNSICSYRDNASRRVHMGALRAKAAELLEAAPAAQGDAKDAARAEKAEADLAESRKWHAKLERTVIEYDDKLKLTEARIKELENFTAPHPDTKLMDFLTSRASIVNDFGACVLRFEMPDVPDGDAANLRDIVRTAMEGDDG